MHALSASEGCAVSKQNCALKREPDRRVALLRVCLCWRVWRCGQLCTRKDVYWTRDRESGAGGNCCSGSRLASRACASLGHCHVLDGDLSECGYRTPPQDVAIVAVASHDHGDRSNSDSGGLFGAGVRSGPRSWNIRDVGVASTRTTKWSISPCRRH